MTTCVIDLGGDDPCRLTMRVIAGLAWESPAMTRSDASAWPSGLRLVFSDDTEWAATVDGTGTSATFTATAEQVAARTNRELVTLRDDAGVYATGQVHVRRMPL